MSKLITIDMTNKEELQITEKMFNLENGVITLALNAPEYDLTGKIITAVFSPSGLETEPLEVVDGAIHIPIYASMIEMGINLIQLNFRWGTTKLEQSGRLMWEIDQSLGTPGPTHRDIDIISYLINEINTAKETADRVVSDVDGSIEDASTAKTALDGSITSANNINNTLSNPTTGTIKLATDSKTALDGSIEDAGTAKSEIEQAITNNQIVTQTEFTAHKEDYANQAEFPLVNLVKNGDFSNGVVDWSKNGSTISVIDNIVKQTSTVAGNANVYQGISPSNLAGDKLYIRAIGRRLSEEISSLVLYTYNGSVSSPTAQSTAPINTWETLSTIVTQPSSGTYIRVYLRMNTTLIGTIAEWRNVLVINLTASFGAGNEPTKEQMDLIMTKLNNWFNGKVQLTNLREMYFKAKEIESKIGTIEDESITINKIQGNVSGKNLFDPGKITVKKYIQPTTNEIINSADYNISEPIPVTVGEPYTLYNCRSVGQFDVSDILISSTNLGDSGNNTVTIIATQPFIKVSVHTIRLNTAQVEKGDVFTGYEPYKRVIPLSLIESFKTGGNSGEVYDQSLNTTDNVKFSSVITTGDIPTGTLAIPPIGLVKGDVWADTTDSAIHPILRVML